MKNVLIVLLLVAAVALGGFVIQKNRMATQEEAKRVAAEKEMKALQASKAEQEQNAAALREKLEAAQMESAANAGAAAKLTVALTNQVAAIEATNAKPANPFAEMFKNPEMREMIKNQQKTVMGTMIDKNYADFFKSMNLTPEQQKAMKDLLLDKMLGNADLGMEMMGGELTAEQRAELTKKMKEASDAINQQLKDLLGAENYSLFENYEKSIPDRMAIDSFKTQLSEGLQLSSAQEDQLRDALSSERQDFKFTTDLNDQQNLGDMKSRFTKDKIDLFLQEQEQLGQRYLARAQSILTPQQYAAYQKSLANQQEMMKLGMSMAAKMFNQ
jgi:hypothetical protein